MQVNEDGENGIKNIYTGNMNDNFPKMEYDK